MFRILGFLLGSTASVVTLLLLVGIPQFHFANPQLDKRRFDEAVEKLKEKRQEVELVAKRVAEDVAVVAQSADGGLPAEVEATTDVDLPGEPAQALSETQQLPAPPADPQWHSFWSPFASEIAAKGFVSQLEKVTGQDYLIKKVDIGRYEVGFAYADEHERQLILAQISAATGLEFPDS
jgi:vacuolar-type H+-ATPase subunit F/Vma7